MAVIVTVNDLTNPALEPYRKLQDRQSQSRAGLFVAEGRSVFARMVESGRHQVQSVLVSPAALVALESSIARLPAETPVYVLPPAEIRVTAGFAIHQGCVALASRGSEPDTSAALQHNPATVVVLEELADPDNVGSIFRSARALGGDAVLLSQGTADPLYRKTIRTSMGAVFDLPYGRSRDLVADVAELRNRGYLVAALTPAAPATTIAGWAAHVADGRKVALLVGNEGDGLSGRLLQAANVRVRVPMRAGADSINVHVAVAVALSYLGRT